MSLIVGPRVLLSIADHGARHAHRTPAGSLAAPAIAAGALFGENRAAEDSSVASEAAEIRVLMEGNMREFDEAHLQEQIRLSKEVFPEMRLVGWYVICEENKPSDLVLELHQKFSRFCESPILVLVQGEENAPETDEMPISVFRLRNSRECEHLRLVVESSEMEKILVEHVAFEISTKQAQESHAVPDLEALLKAISTLKDHVKVILSYLSQVLSSSPEAIADPETIQLIGEICSRLPLVDTASFDREFLANQLDSQMMLFLSTLTQISALTSSAVRSLNASARSKIETDAPEEQERISSPELSSRA